VQTIAARRAQALVDDGTFDGGIVPKLLAAAAAVRSGVAAEIGVTAVTA
jgi:acetylglutamate kinase